jgi:hypothetical protein
MRLLKLKNEVKNLKTALDAKYEMLGALALQHRPSDVDVTEEIMELSAVQDELAQRRTTLESLCDTRGTGPARKELTKEIAKAEARQRELIITIGRKTLDARPQLAEAEAHFAAVDQIRTSLFGKEDQVVALQSQLERILAHRLPSLQSFVKPLIVGCVAVGAVLAVWLLWAAVGVMFRGPLIAAPFCYYVPDTATGVGYINLTKLRESDLYAEFDSAVSRELRRLPFDISEDDVNELLFVMLDGGREVTVARIREDLPAEEVVSGTDDNAKLSEYQEFEYVRTGNSYRGQYVAKTAPYTFCIADDESSLRNVLRTFERQEESELDDDLRAVLRRVSGQDHYLAMRRAPGHRHTAFPGDVVVLVRTLTGAGSANAFGIGTTISTSSVSLEAATAFRTERDGRRLEEEFAAWTAVMEEQINNSRHSQARRDAMKQGVDMLKEARVWNTVSGKLATRHWIARLPSRFHGRSGWIPYMPSSFCARPGQPRKSNIRTLSA